LLPEDERKRYLLHDNSPENSGYVEYLESFLGNAVLPFAAPGSRILDFGSGPRPLLSAMLAARGYETSSWDPFFMDDRSAKAGPFDMVVAHEVIEHCARPSQAAREISDSLRPGGRASLSTLFRPESEAAFASWWYRQDSTHVSFFTAASLAALFRGYGLLPVWNDGKSRMVLEKSG
jgi:2-polyprenyl-3-methyl-5-hydroxy-6-metoxy-1,4-benzoquinol methylase